MRSIEQHYIGGAFVASHGQERFDLINPATEAVIGQVTLGDAEDARRAVAAAKAAFPAFSRTSKAERIALLRRIEVAVAARVDELEAAMVEEYGAPVTWAGWAMRYSAESFGRMADTLEGYDFSRRIGTAEVVMTPVGVAAMITPWNSNVGFICGKLATAIAAGCTAVIKPSEMSALQTQVVLEALHEAGIPPGVFNLVNGRGDTVGAEFSAHRDVSKISFTGSTAVGKSILRTGTDTLKRVTLELGGKSPTVILDDADLPSAMAIAVNAGFVNSGQACLAGTRILIPKQRMDEAIELAKSIVAGVKVGNPNDVATQIGPMVSRKQWQRVQDYIRLGREEGASVIVGGEGLPAHLDAGFFVRPTVFANVRNDMRIAQEEIFGPVLCLIGYDNEEDAIAIANDTVYGLQAIVIGKDKKRARAVAERLDAGRVLVNGILHEPNAPFGGFKQSGIGREFGVFGLEAYLEPKSLLGVVA
ncbi:aldehyde dehydrogenase (NAD+) [Luteibacter rhizovicinus]|uniref:aldehyde dehydrogenase (NAD(+)) n=1 Tax=Luteibacter rhizovicinus TaxID=242606 RepID=A0A4R3YVC5_9GAMM|nr:aldehyde dehydrogenase family protein [Luteibacter rhizovicinus]TCV97055.1 aldehyde dehydrogenase (NAD+) [Luteibacter rhizovicinus]